MSNTDSHLRTVDGFNACDWSSIAAGLAEDCELIDHARSFTAKGANSGSKRRRAG